MKLINSKEKKNKKEKGDFFCKLNYDNLHKLSEKELNDILDMWGGKYKTGDWRKK